MKQLFLITLILFGTLSLAQVNEEIEDAPDTLTVPNFDAEGMPQDLVTTRANLETHLEENPDDESALFALGVTEFFIAFEHLGQAWYRYGLNADFIEDADMYIGSPSLPFGNPKPEKMSHSKFSKVTQQLVDDLSQAEATLAGINQDDVAFFLRFEQIPLDFNNDGLVENSLWSIYHSFNSDFVDPEAPELTLRLDRGDAHWLRGYCHLLMTGLEIIIAHDTQELFETTAHIFFPKVATPYDSVLSNKATFFDDGYSETSYLWVDAFTFLHFFLRIELDKPKRLKNALHHAEAVNEQSREMWEHILAETDDELEWIPNPNQQSVVPTAVDEEMIESWLGFVEEAEAIWAGEKLIPHWRLPEGTGINLRKVFLKPQTLDIVMWIQGSAAVPYQKKGETIDPAVFEGLIEVFGGDALGFFAIWFN